MVPKSVLQATCQMRGVSTCCTRDELSRFFEAAKNVGSEKACFVAAKNVGSEKA